MKGLLVRDGWGGHRRLSCMYVSAGADLPPPAHTLHVACCMCMLASQSQLRCPSAARLGLFSHAKAACHESWLGCGSRAWPRWSCLGWLCIPDCHCARSLQATNMLTCEPPDVLWCLVWLVLGCEMRVVVSQSVAECHSVANGVRTTCVLLSGGERVPRQRPL